MAFAMTFRGPPKTQMRRGSSGDYRGKEKMIEMETPCLYQTEILHANQLVGGGGERRQEWDKESLSNLPPKWTHSCNDSVVIRDFGALQWVHGAEALLRFPICFTQRGVQQQSASISFNHQRGEDTSTSCLWAAEQLNGCPKHPRWEARLTLRCSLP